MKPSFITHILTSIKHQKSFRESQYGATSFAYVHSDHFALLTCQQKYKHAHPYSTHTHTHTHLPPGRSWLRSVCSNIAMGIPTFLERPATSTFFPTVSIPAQKKIYFS